MTRKLLIFIVLFFLLTGCVKVSENNDMTNSQSNTELLAASCANPPQKTAEKTYSANPCVLPDAELKSKKAVIETTMGTITVELFDADSPYTVSNFIFLAKENYYNDTIFHRVIEPFVIQGGDPLGNGMGGPGYDFADEINSHKVDKGALAMANSGPNTNGSQFFIVTKGPQTHLDGKHTVFGKVIEGMEIVDKIAAVDVDDSDKPLTDVKITKISIEDLN